MNSNFFSCFLQIEIADEDKFLGRAMGSRGVKDKDSIKKDTALAHYLPHMQKEIFIVYHSVYSDCPDVPLFCLKVLSRLMGYSFIPFNASKVMLLEKTAALRIFGYGPGYWASRAGYFLCYSSYAMADKKTDVSKLQGYSRKKFLRYRGDMPEETTVKRLKK